MCNTHQGYLYSVKAPPVKGVIRSKLSPNDISLLCAKGGGAALAVTEELLYYHFAGCTNRQYVLTTPPSHLR